MRSPAARSKWTPSSACILTSFPVSSSTYRRSRRRRRRRRSTCRGTRPALPFGGLRLHDRIDQVEAQGLIGVSGDRQADPHEVSAPARDGVHHGRDTAPVLGPPRRAAEGAHVASLDAGHEAVVVVAAEHEDDGARLACLHHLAYVCEPIEDVGSLEPARDPSFDRVGGVERAVSGDLAEHRLARTTTRESPAIHSRSFFSGVNFTRCCGAAGVVTGVGASAPTRRPRRPRRRPSGRALPSARREAGRAEAPPLRPSSGPVTPSATSRFQPSGWIVADLWRPGAFRRARPGAPPRTTIADPAEAVGAPLRGAATRTPGRCLVRFHQNWK